MGPFYLILALLVQNSYTETIADSEEKQIDLGEILQEQHLKDGFVPKDYEPNSNDWMDMFILPSSGGNIFPTSSATLMAQATFTDKSPEDQLEAIKNMAEDITKQLQSEMAHLLSYAVALTDKGVEDNTLRRKRSIETPMDSTQLVMRLLKHIKSNNEYQNIAIEKMMTAQEIANKYGIEFNPDPEILSDLAVAANEQAKEMSEILKDTCDLKNVTQKHEVLDDEKVNSVQNHVDCVAHKPLVASNPTAKVLENITDDSSQEDHDTFSHYNYYYNYPYESQIPAPPVHYHSEPVSPRPNFYDYISFNPNQDYTPYCSIEPMPSMFMDPYLEPELVGEEYEETVSSKISIGYEEPGVTCADHVTTYTLSEKAHFRNPQIENLPQQMQYYFFLM